MPESSNKIKEKVEELLRELFFEKKLLSAVLSNAHSNNASEPHKVSIRPVLMKGKELYQATFYIEKKVVHSNFDASEALSYITSKLDKGFKQLLLCTEEKDYQLLIGRKGQWTLLKQPPSKKALSVLHNRSKEYLLSTEEPLPFLVYLGIMTKEGKVIPKMSHKFRQINRFLEMVTDVLDQFPKEKALNIIDFGSGKAYLTFALYHYLQEVKGFSVNILGLDLKEDVVNFCQKTAIDLKMKGLKFAVGDIHHHMPDREIDMVVSLHACDTATDAAIEKAISWKAKVIMAVPCCQKEAYRQIKSESLHALLKHGILKERFAALATDAIRAQLLELAGYKTQVMEFIDLEHTPKNLLIRAIKSEGGTNKKKLQEEYRQFRDFLHLKPMLEQLLG